MSAERELLLQALEFIAELRVPQTKDQALEQLLRGGQVIDAIEEWLAQPIETAPEELKLRLLNAERAAARLRGIRELMGYIEAGEGDTVSLFQDDATKNYFIKVGKRSWFANSFEGAIDVAVHNISGEQK